MSEITFTVLGKAQPQGSVRAFMVGGKPRLTSDNEKMKPWRQQVGWAALEARGEFFAHRNTPVRAIYSFYLAPPQKLPKGRTRATAKPDVDKLIRAISDALTGVVWEDDSQLVEVTAKKQYGLPPRTEITVESL